MYLTTNPISHLTYNTLLQIHSMAPPASAEPFVWDLKGICLHVLETNRHGSYVLGSSI